MCHHKTVQALHRPIEVGTRFSFTDCIQNRSGFLNFFLRQQRQVERDAIFVNVEILLMIGRLVGFVACIIPRTIIPLRPVGLGPTLCIAVFVSLEGIQPESGLFFQVVRLLASTDCGGRVEDLLDDLL